MRHQPTMTPSPVGGPFRLRRTLMLLFAAVLTLGFLTPLQAAQAAQGALLVRDASVVEGDASTVAVRIVLERRVNRRVTVSYRTIERTARNGVDFAAVSGTVRFPAGTKARTVRVPVLDDALDEASERFQLRIHSAVGASIVDRTGRVTIFDDDPAPTMSVGDASVTEPTSGSSTLSFPVTLSARSGRTISVSYVVTAGTATSGTDFVASSTGQLVLPAGTTTATIPVTVLGDNVLESSETVQVTLHSPVNVTLIDSSAVGTILDNTAPRLSVGDVTVTEGDPARFVVSLNKPAPQTVTFRYSTSNGTASSSSDYSGVSNGSGSIPAGASSTTITVNTTENTTAEPTETFNLTLSNVVNAVVTDGQAVGTILDDEGMPTLSVADVSVQEGDAAQFVVLLSKPAVSQVTFTYSTSNGTATSPGDYAGVSNTTTTIAAGSSSKTITVQTNEDTAPEANETFNFTVTNVTNATVTDGQARATIVDDDTAPTVSISDASRPENQDMVFTVTLSKASGVEVRVGWSTANGTATSPADYTADSGIVTIPAGQTSATLTVRVNNDNLAEPAETFVVNLSGPQNATIADGQGTGTIESSD